MKKKLSIEEAERRRTIIDAGEAEKLSPEEAAALAEAEAEDDGTAVTLEEFKKSMKGYSGKLVLRIPRSRALQLLHPVRRAVLSRNCPEHCVRLCGRTHHLLQADLRGL